MDTVQDEDGNVLSGTKTLQFENGNTKETSIQQDNVSEVTAQQNQANETFCEPCDEGGSQNPAVGFCTDCEEFLCSGCFHYHKRQKAFKNHALQDKSQMPKDRSSIQVKDVCVTKCQVHNDEMIKFFCTVREKLGCCACIIADHKDCKFVNYIPEFADSSASSTEYQFWLSEAEKLSNTLEKYNEKLRIKGESCEMTRKDAIEKIKQAKQDIISVFDELERTTIRHVEEKYLDDQRIIKAAHDFSNRIKLNLNHLKSDLELKDKHGQLCEKFFALKNAIVSLEQLKENSKALYEEAREAKYVFSVPDDLLFKVKAIKDFGKLGCIEPAYFSNDIVVKDNIAGVCVFSENVLVATDRDSQGVYTIDLSLNRVAYSVSLISIPSDIARLKHDNKVAVALSSAAQIQYLTVEESGHVTIGNVINVRGVCWGIACSDDYIIVAYGFGDGLDFLTTSGQVQKQIKHGNLFEEPYYIVFNPLNNLVYVSDWKKRKVTSLTLDGEVKATNQNFKYPRGITVDKAGKLYVCDWTANEVVELSEDLNERHVILGSEDGLHEPECITCDANRTLYVGTKSVIKVYAVKYFN